MSAGQLAVLVVIGAGALIAVLAALATWTRDQLSKRREHQRCEQIAQRMAQDAAIWRQNLTSEKKLKPVAPVRDSPPTGPRRRVVWPSATPNHGGHTTSTPHASAS